MSGCPTLHEQQSCPVPCSLRWCCVRAQLLDKRRHDHEAEMKDLESRFTHMLQLRQQAFDRDIARVRDDAQERSQEGVNAAVDRVRSTAYWGFCLSFFGCCWCVCLFGFVCLFYCFTASPYICFIASQLHVCLFTCRQHFVCFSRWSGELIDQMETALRNQRAEIAAPLQREVEMVRAHRHSSFLPVPWLSVHHLF